MDTKAKGYDPYNTTPRDKVQTAVDVASEAQRREAEQLLRCFETPLELAPEVRS